MKKYKKLVVIFVLVAGVGLMAACGGSAAPQVATSTPSAPTAKPATAVPATAAPTATSLPPTPVPASATPQPPTSTSVPPQATEAATASAASGYDGDWEGTSSTNSPLNFRVENNKISYLTINYSYNSGGCSIGGAYGNGPENAVINGGQFSAQITDSDGVEYSISGTMTSPTEANGTLEVKGKTFCGDTDAKATWTAKKATAGSTGGDNATPTEVAQQELPTAENNLTDAKSVFGLFFLSLDTKDVAGAMDEVSDSVVFKIGTTTGVGKDKLRAYFQQQVDQGITYMGSNVNITGDIVTFSVQAIQPSGAVAATYNHSVVTVQDGKIATLTLQ